MLYRRKHCKFWWVMFRDPARPGKWVRLSTKLTDKAAAAEVERAVALGLHKTIQQNALERILRAVYNSEDGMSGMALLSAWAQYERVQRQRGKDPTRKTIVALRCSVERFVKYAREERGLKFVKQVSSAVAMDYAEELKKGTVKKSGERRPLKDKSRKNIIEGLSSVWRVLGGIDPEIHDPWRNCVPIVRDAERRQAFTREQEVAILDAAGRGKLPEWRTICLVARHTGLRKGDIFKLKWDQVDLERGVIRLTPNKTRNFQIAVAVPMVGELWEEMRNKASGTPADAGAGKTQGGDRRLAPSAQDKGAFVFARFAKTYPNDPPEECFADVLARVGVTGAGLTFHSWRHTFRTRLKEAGVPDELAKQLGGWTQDATLARYNHADETEKLRKMMEEMK